MGLSLNGGSALATPFAAARAIVEADSGDVDILIIGDSTSNDTTDWAYLFGQWLVAQHPTHTVNYYLWNDGGSAYAAATVLGTGSGSNDINIWNASITGTRPEYLMGAKFAAAIGNLTPDAIIWNHGHNLAAQGFTDAVLRGAFLGPIEQVALAHPGVQTGAIIQNPRRDDNLSAAVMSCLNLISTQRGDFPLIDAYSPFIAQNKDGSLYADSVHPSASGTQLILTAVKFAWQGARGLGRLPAWLAANGTNIATNGDFAAFSGALPDGWSKSGDGTVTKDTSIVAPGSAYSVKITNGTTPTFIFQNIAATPYRGQNLTIAAKIYLDNAADLNSGRTRIFLNGTGAIVQVANPGFNALDGWRWVIISGAPIPGDATLVGPYIYANSAGNKPTDLYVDRVILVEGLIPRNMA